MRSARLVLVATAVAATLACDEVAPAGPSWGSDDPDGDNGNDDDSGETTGDDDPVGPGRNNPPRAQAGRDQLGVEPDTIVNLDASGSSDIDGDPLTYTWALTSKPPGSVANLSNPTFAATQFLVDKPGDYVATVTVSDGRETAEDDVRIQVLVDNNPPRANAGLDQNVSVGTTVQLVGNGSTDPDGDALEYYWTLSTPLGSGATLSGASIPSTAATPTFVADVAGIFTASLEVDDGEIRSAPDMVTITSRGDTGGGTSGGTTGGSSSSDCLDCAAQAEQVAVTAWTTGDLASGFGLLVFPVFVTLWQRRRDD